MNYFNSILFVYEIRTIEAFFKIQNALIHPVRKPYMNLWIAKMKIFNSVSS